MTQEIGENEILTGLYKSVTEGDTEAVQKFSKMAVEQNIPTLKAINEGLSKGIQEIGDRFGRNEIYLPELIISADAMNAGLDILMANLKKGEKFEKKGKVVLGTVKGDVHEIGKNIVSILLSAKGFDVYDLGTDVDPKAFVKKAEEVGADIIGMSTLMTTTMIYQKDTIKLAENMGVAKKYFMVVGGGVIEPSWVKKINADGYGKMAADAVKLCERLMEERPSKPLNEPVVVE
ncbi:MAG: cobalamin-dependent protein [Methanobacteriota archaeon]